MWAIMWIALGCVDNGRYDGTGESTKVGGVAHDEDHSNDH